jgi:hypothetical protein
MTLEGQEEYLGGFSSPHLVRGMMRGYELHATSKRLIGVKNRKAGGGWMLGVGVGGVIGGAVAGRVTSDQSAKTIQELDQKKDFSVLKDQISRIEVKKPGTFTRGHIVVSLRSGDPVEVKIAEKRAYEQTMHLIQKFYPEALRPI